MQSYLGVGWGRQARPSPTRRSSSTKPTDQEGKPRAPAPQGTPLSPLGSQRDVSHGREDAGRAVLLASWSHKFIRARSNEWSYETHQPWQVPPHSALSLQRQGKERLGVSSAPARSLFTSAIYFISKWLRCDQYAAPFSFPEVQSEVKQGRTAPQISSRPQKGQTSEHEATRGHGVIAESAFKQSSK